ncbi:2-deoxystreptamine glucosyltransferase [bacterium HR09]|nr:2-deoxystreptamine glucosyltransferase [bacterium HR09]
MKSRPLRILAVASYYRPYLSGLTVYLQRLAEALSATGQEVVVLTSRFPPDVPSTEVREAVRIVRVPVWMKVGKGVFMPGLFRRFWLEVQNADVVWLVLPQAEAAPLAWLAKKAGKPLVVSYLCDVRLGKGWGNRLVEALLAASHRRCLQAADAVVALSEDYVSSSPLLLQLRQRVRVIPPPIPKLESSPPVVSALRERWGLKPGEPVVGYVGRVSREKGLHTLAQAMPHVWAVLPEVRVVCVGPRQEVPGERGYLKEVERLVRPLGRRWLFAGVLSNEELAAFYRCCSVLVLPSLNSTEAFGMVQVEAMICGTPVVASDLPGVREPVRLTGMGVLVPAGDPQALASGLLQVLEGRFATPLGQRAVLDRFSPQAVVQSLLPIFTEISRGPLGRGNGTALE